MTKEQFARIVQDAFDNHLTDRDRSRDEWWAAFIEVAGLRRMADFKMGRR